MFPIDIDNLVRELYDSEYNITSHILSVVTEGRILGKRHLGRFRTRCKDKLEKHLKMIHKNLQIKDVNDRDQCK